MPSGRCLISSKLIHLKVNQKATESFIWWSRRVFVWGTKVLANLLFNNKKNIWIWTSISRYFRTCIWSSGPAHRKHCTGPNWTRSSTRRSPGSCHWCRGAVHQSSCSCCNPPDVCCQPPTSVPASPHSRTATAAHTRRPAPAGLNTQIRVSWKRETEN